MSWYTDDPDLTDCFKQTVLVWVPCVFLWLFSSLDVFYIINSKKRDIPWNWLNISKLFFTCCLLVLTVVDLGTGLNKDEETYNVEIYTPVLKIFTFVSIHIRKCNYISLQLILIYCL